MAMKTMKAAKAMKAMKIMETTAAATKPASPQKGPMKQSCMSNIAKNKYIRKQRNGFVVRKKIRGEDCTFASGKHLTIEQAKLIAGKVGELAKMTNDKTEIMNGLKPFAKKHNIALSKPYFANGVKRCGIPNIAENKYISNKGKALRVLKVIGGKVCNFAYGKHLTLEKAKLIAGKVCELAKMN